MSSIETQSDEFDAVEKLSKAWRNLQLTPIVDDDYPEVRHYYESALRVFIDACNKNGRRIRSPSDELTFAVLRTANETRCKRWHKNGIEEWSISDWAVAMAGEAGECCNAVKKFRRIETGAANISEPGRQLSDKESAIKAIGEEIADTLCYLDLLAYRIGLSLEDEVRKKFNAVSIKYNFPERI